MRFLGEFLCAIDNRNRLRVPSSLLKQLMPEDKGRFIINKGFEKCLVLYPHSVWDNVATKVERLNNFSKENRMFKRTFLRGASEIILDNADRILIPKILSDYADLKQECILSSNGSTIEVWHPEVYNQLMSLNEEEYAGLAEKVMSDEDRTKLS